MSHDQPAPTASAPIATRPPRAVSRRALFRGLAAAGALGAASARSRRSAARANPPDVSADVDPGSLLTKLVRRVTQGLTTPEVTLAQQMGYQAYLEYHLNYTAIDDSAADAAIAALTTLNMIPQQLFQLQAGQVISELTEALIKRSLLSNRQLYQRMVEFWTDHFNIDITKEPCNYLKTVDDRDVIRANALGTFPALLSASAHSPCMLVYLDNQTSVTGNPNENYARELMELHTLGVDGGYTQQDVHEVARCLTGWGLYPNNTGALSGTFRYNSAQHDTAPKTIFQGTPYQLNIPARSAAAGIQDGIDVLNALSNHPSTAAFIAKKLCKWLISETPSQPLINSVAAAYTSSGGDIKAMIRAALAPNVLADAPPKFKRPYHLFLSAMRSMSATVTTIRGMTNNLTSAGHLPFYWGPPDGYPDTLEYWSGLELPRWNFGASLLAGQIPGCSVNVTSFFSGATTATQCVARINNAFFAGEMPQSDQDRIRAYLLPDPPSASRQSEALGLVVASPGFQWY